MRVLELARLYSSPKEWFKTVETNTKQVRQLGKVGARSGRKLINNQLLFAHLAHKRQRSVPWTA